MQLTERNNLFCYRSDSKEKKKIKVIPQGTEALRIHINCMPLSVCERWWLRKETKPKEIKGAGK